MSPELGSDVKQLLLAVLIPRTFSRLTLLLELFLCRLCRLFLPAACVLFAALTVLQSAPSAMISGSLLLQHRVNGAHGGGLSR